MNLYENIFTSLTGRLLNAIIGKYTHMYINNNAKKLWVRNGERTKKQCYDCKINNDTKECVCVLRNCVTVIHHHKIYISLTSHILQLIHVEISSNNSICLLLSLACSLVHSQSSWNDCVHIVVEDNWNFFNFLSFHFNKLEHNEIKYRIVFEWKAKLFNYSLSLDGYFMYIYDLSEGLRKKISLF
jgi:hypothetical protein